MQIGLDFDDTYTLDPEAWNTFIRYFVSRGHVVYCTTYRGPEKSAEVYATIGEVVGRDRCFFTNGTPKKQYMRSHGILIDVWIDDKPKKIYKYV